MFVDEGRADVAEPRTITSNNEQDDIVNAVPFSTVKSDIDQQSKQNLRLEKKDDGRMSNSWKNKI